MTERRQAKNKKATVTRQEHKEQKEVIQELSAASMSKSSIKMVLLRLVAIILLVLVAMIVGSMIGYGVIGDGDAMDVLKPATWTHVFDMMDGTQDK